MPAPLEHYEQSTLERLRDAALALLPPGRAFSRRLESMIARVLEALSMEPARVHFEASVLRVHASPRRATRLDYLEAWEEAAGVTQPVGTIAQRAAHAAGIIRGRRAFNLSAYQAIATELGYTLPGALKMEAQFFRVGTSAVGEPLIGESWAYALVGEVQGANAPMDLLALEAAWATRVKRAHTLVRARVGGAPTYVLIGDDPVVINADRVVL